MRIQNIIFFLKSTISVILSIVDKINNSVYNKIIMVNINNRFLIKLMFAIVIICIFYINNIFCEYTLMKEYNLFDEIRYNLTHPREDATFGLARNCKRILENGNMFIAFHKEGCSVFVDCIEFVKLHKTRELGFYIVGDKNCKE
jgi:hypothetical protein